jgi:hypothetical protein
VNNFAVSVIIAVSCWPVVTSAQSRLSQPSSSDEVVIDGTKNPELFPEWFIWQQTLRALDRLAATSKTPLYHGLDISGAEWTLIQQEIKVFHELQSTLEKQLLQTRKAAAAERKTEDETRDATHVVNLDYRHKVLDIGQRVSERLSPESLTRLRAWINELVRGTTVSLRGRAIKLFREPR